MPFRLTTTGLFFMLLYVSCSTGGRQATELERQAERLLATNPDSALKVIDSALRLEGGKAAGDAAKTRLLLMRQQAYAGQRLMDSVISTGVRIRKLALLNGDSLSIAKSLLPVRGEVSMADQRELEPFLPGAARIFAARGMRYEEAVIEGLTGAIATRKGQFAESMKHLYRARDIQEGLDSVKPLFAVYMNIGNNLSGMKDLRGSIGFYEKAAQVARKLNDSIRIATALMNEGVVRSDLRVFDSSRLRFNEALASLPARGGEYARMQIDYNLATVSHREGDMVAAEAAFRKLVDQAEAMGDPFAVGMANSGLAGVLGKTDRVGPAIRLMEATLRQQESMGMGYYTLEQTEKLVSLYKLDGRYRDALEATERMNLLGDSLAGVDKQREVRELSVKYDFATQEREKVALAAKLRQRNLLAAGLSLAVLGLVAFGALLRQRNRYQRELTASYQRLLEQYRNRRDDPDSLVPSYVAVPLEQVAESETAETSIGDESKKASHNEEADESDRLVFELVRSHFKADKPYLNADLKVEEEAKSIEVPARRLSQAVKSLSGLGFSDFVNGYRIAEASRVMDAPGSESLKLEVIASRCGFNSRQQFRRVFEQVTGVSPGFYRSRPSDGGSV
jgi:AraC-like DNA-binding protein